jgi:hypothetical protein
MSGEVGQNSSKSFHSFSVVDPRCLKDAKMFVSAKKPDTLPFAKNVAQSEKSLNFVPSE